MYRKAGIVFCAVAFAAVKVHWSFLLSEEAHRKSGAGVLRFKMIVEENTLEQRRAG